MIGERELVALLYRADWTRLSLSGEVYGSDERVASMLTFIQAHRADSGGPFPPFPPFGPMRPGVTRLLLAPGKRYRKDSEHGWHAEGSDGERIWLWAQSLPGPPPGLPPGEMRLGGGPEPPFPALLCPSWLLAGYDLQIREPVTACGRDGIRVTARARNVDPLPYPRFPASLPLARFEHVDAIVDAELGILLRCEQRNGDQAAELAEFRTLTVDPAVDPERFTAPPGAVFGEPHGQHTMSFGPFDMPLRGPAWDVAKTAAGLAAGGMGAALRYSPFGPFGPFGRRPPRPDPDDAEAAMPRDDQAPDDPADEAPAGDEVLHLLYRGGAGVPAFTATLHEWSDPAGLLAAVPESARAAGFGGVGYLVDTIADAARVAPAASHAVSSVRIGGWDRYRIDRVHGTPRTRRRLSVQLKKPVTVACDGQRRWRVYDDRVSVGPAGPPPAEITDLIDGSWLLRCELSGGAEVSVGGRRAFRVRVVPRDQAASSLLMFRFPAVALVDAETGRLLRFTSYARGKPVARHELRDVALGDSGDFGFEPPPGLRVTEDEDEAEADGRA